MGPCGPLGDEQCAGDLLVADSAAQGPRTSRSRSVSGSTGSGSERRFRMRCVSSRATSLSRWISPACAARMAAATSSASASFRR